VLGYFLPEHNFWLADVEHVGEKLDLTSFVVPSFEQQVRRKLKGIEFLDASDVDH
jgi:hypothetical protein